MYSAFAIELSDLSKPFKFAKLVIGSYFANYSKTITHQAEIFKESFLPSLSLYHVSYV